jgi:hypothetical protein
LSIIKRVAPPKGTKAAALLSSANSSSHLFEIPPSRESIALGRRGGSPEFAPKTGARVAPPMETTATALLS